MATKAINLPKTSFLPLKKTGQLRFGIVKASWNLTITQALSDGAKRVLLEEGVELSNIFEIDVPGSFELPLAAQWLAQAHTLDAVICIGVLIKGDTPHFEYISEAVAHGIMHLNLNLNIPVVFGVLTTLNEQQALDRTGGTHGHKGEEAATTALQMLQIKQSLNRD